MLLPVLKFGSQSIGANLNFDLPSWSRNLIADTEETITGFPGGEFEDNKVVRLSDSCSPLHMFVTKLGTLLRLEFCHAIVKPQLWAVPNP